MSMEINTENKEPLKLTNSQDKSGEVKNVNKGSSSANLAEDELFDASGNFCPPLKPLIISVSGKPSTGKSYFVKSLIYYYTKLKYFRFGLVLTRTKFTGGYEWMPDEYVKDEYNEEYLVKYFQKLKKYKEKTGTIPANFLIIDDFMGSINLYSPFWMHLISCFRHYNVSIIISAQSVVGKGASSTLLRECCNLSVMFRTVFKNTLVGLYECYGGLFEDYNEFINTFLRITSQKHHFMMFVNDKPDKESSYFDVIAPPNVPEFKLKF